MDQISLVLAGVGKAAIALETGLVAQHEWISNWTKGEQSDVCYLIQDADDALMKTTLPTVRSLGYTASLPGEIDRVLYAKWQQQNWNYGDILGDRAFFDIPKAKELGYSRPVPLQEGDLEFVYQEKTSIPVEISTLQQKPSYEETLDQQAASFLFLDPKVYTYFLGSKVKENLSLSPDKNIGTSLVVSK